LNPDVLAGIGGSEQGGFGGCVVGAVVAVAAGAGSAFYVDVVGGKV